MTIKHLRVFVAVCEQGGITKAANALHMVQPAVSTAISELERYYKASLFDRINQRLVLTELGKELLVKAKRILEEFDDFQQTAIFGGENPRIRIGSSLTLGKTVLPGFLASIRKSLPCLDPVFVIDKTAVIEEMLECGRLDFGIVEGDVKIGHLKKLPFGKDKLTPVCAPYYAVPKSITLEQLTQHPLLLREAGSASRDLFSAALAQRHLSVKPFVESVSNQALISFAEQGHGIAVLPEGIVKEGVSSGALCTLEITDADMSRTHYVIMHKNKYLSELCLSAIELLKDNSAL